MRSRMVILVLGWGLVTGAVPIHALEVALGSTSGIKREAIKQAFSLAFPEQEIKVQAISSASTLPRQPVGLAAGLQGGEERIANIPPALCESADFVVGIENYIARDEQDRWYDRAAVVIRNQKTGVVSKYLSDTVSIPEDFVLRAYSESSHKSEQGLDVTVGSVIAKAFGERRVDSADWHREREFGGVS